MLRFTSAGVVAAPRALQIRLGPRYSGRVKVGAPRPSRRMTDAEVLGNLRFFTEGMRGPRSAPAELLVLSGVEADRHHTLPELLRAARGLGIARVVAHVGRTMPVEPAGLDAVVLRLQEPDDVVGVRGPVTGVVELEVGRLGIVEQIVLRAVAEGLERLVLTWPFPPHGRPAPPHEVRALLARLPIGRTATRIHLRGLPPCLVWPHDLQPRRMRNRWYVDADHQRECAMVFLPDVLRLRKVDACRYCAFDSRCDGVAAGWFEQGDLRLEPVDRSRIQGLDG